MADSNEKPVDQTDENTGPEATVDGLQEKVKELTAAVTKLSGDQTGMVEQIKELRKQKQEAEEALAAAKATPKPAGSEDIVSVVEGVFQKRQKAEAEKNRKVAFAQFIAENKEFHPDNDVAGLKRDLLESAMKKINTSESFSVDEILADYQLAVGVINRSRGREESVLGNFANTPSGDGKGNAGKPTPKLSAEQEKLRQEMGWTVEKYLGQKAKHPTIVP